MTKIGQNNPSFLQWSIQQKELPIVPTCLINVTPGVLDTNLKLYYDDLRLFSTTVISEEVWVTIFMECVLITMHHM